MVRPRMNHELDTSVSFFILTFRMSIRDVERVCAALSQLKTHPDFPKPGVTMLDT